jgi:hypothetical protein
MFLLSAGFLLLGPPSALAVTTDDPVSHGRVEAGYQAVSIDANPDRAAEYSFLDSSPTLGLDLRGGSGVRHYIFDGVFLNENDYRAEAHLDHNGFVNLNLRTERFFHNLEHIPYAPGLPEARGDTGGQAATSSGAVRVQYADQDPGKNYGIRLDTSEAHLRGKFKTFPAHLNLRYWRFEKKGSRQLRFVDEGFDHPDIPNTLANGQTCNACHMQSKTRNIDRVTDEISAAVDAHLGPVDIAVEQLYREFRNRESIPIDTFQGHPLRPAGLYQHDADPDARLTETTLKMHTSLSGGVSAAASLTVGERENRSALATGQPFGVDRGKAETDYYKAAGDLTYTPSPQWTLNFRYRLLDLDSDNPESIAAYGNDFNVRENVDLRRSSHEAIIAWRPVRSWTFKGEYQIEKLRRGNTGGPEPHHGFQAPIAEGGISDDVWELPQDEVLQRLKLGILARPLGIRSLKLHLWYQYRTSDDPAYAAAFENRHEIFFTTTYSPSAHWGLNLTAKALEEENDRQRKFLFDHADNPVSVELDRQREQQDMAFGAWANPVSRLLLGANYGYMRTRIRQDLLFGTDLGDGGAVPPVASHSILDSLVEYSQRVHTVSANTSLRLTRAVNLRFEGYHIRSFAEFSPDFFISAPPLDLPASSAELKELSRLDIRQNGLSAGLDWTPAPDWNCSFRYTYNDYEDRESSTFDGTAQTYMVSAARAW